MFAGFERAVWGIFPVGWDWVILVSAVALARGYVGFALGVLRAYPGRTLAIPWSYPGRTPALTPAVPRHGTA